MLQTTSSERLICYNRHSRLKAQSSTQAEDGVAVAIKPHGTARAQKSSEHCKQEIFVTSKLYSTTKDFYLTNDKLLF